MWELKYYFNIKQKLFPFQSSVHSYIFNEALHVEFIIILNHLICNTVIKKKKKST